ncbi:MAG TPA: lipoyl synthase [Bacteroidales bacterium]|nr:lipoyl synthase [Bacteroidales bacterium]
MDNRKKKPAWLKTKLPGGKKYMDVREVVEQNKLHTICTSGKCPNIAECWGNGTATFMILGEICTRSCKFCATKTGKPLPPDWQEPERLAETIRLMKLNHCVITSVDRDDLEDGGAAIWAATIREIKKKNPEATIEALIPDFNANTEHIQQVMDAAPEIISHNLETVKRLTPIIRSKAKYEVSLKTLEIISQSSSVRAKSGIMAGLGETEEEVYKTMDELLETGCRIMTIGQYLQPRLENWPVHEYVTPEQFEKYKNAGLEKGFEIVESAPLVRSSYHAEKHIKNHE